MTYKKTGCKYQLPVLSLGVIIWSLAATFFLYEFFLRTFVGSVAHQVIYDLGLNAETFSIVCAAYYISYGVMQIPVGILTDKFGVKQVMVFATLLCTLSTFLFAHSLGFLGAFISRFLMGLGSSFAFVCLLVVVITWFPKKYFAFFTGISQFIGTMGPFLAGGPLIMLMSSYHETWRVALSQIGLFGLLLSVLTIIFVKNKPRNREDELIFLRQDDPIKNRLMRLIKQEQVWYVALYSGLVYVSMALLGAVWGGEYLRVRGLSQSMAANIISLAWLGYAIGCPLLGGISDVTKRRKPTLIFCSVLGMLTTGGIIYLPLGHLHRVYGILFFGLGVAAAGQNIGFVTISEQVDLPIRATALGLNNAMITLFDALFTPALSYFIYWSSRPSYELKPEDFIMSFSVMPLLYVASLLIAFFFIEETYCRTQKGTIVLGPDFGKNNTAVKKRTVLLEEQAVEG